MSESDDYKAFKKHTIRPLDRVDRIENIMIVGMPDINLCIEGVESWVELKSPKEPKREKTSLFGSNHKLSQDQKNWFLRQKNAEGRGFILIATDNRWILMNGVWADQINDLSIRGLLSVSSWNANKPVEKEEWEQLRKILSQ